MRYLAIFTSEMTGPPDPEHMAKVRKSVEEGVRSGTLLATGGLGKRTTAGFRVYYRSGDASVEAPPEGDGGWMAKTAFSLIEANSHEEAVANCKLALEAMGDGVLEVLQVSEVHPPPRAARPALSGVTPYVSIEGAAKAVEFYKTAFGASEVDRRPAEDGQRLMHCHLKINGGDFMLCDVFPEYGHGYQQSRNYMMHLHSADARAVWDRATAAGASVVMPLDVQFWGDLYGELKDPFGVHWTIGQTLAPAS